MNQHWSQWYSSEKYACFFLTVALICSCVILLPCHWWLLISDRSRKSCAVALPLMKQPQLTGVVVIASENAVFCGDLWLTDQVTLVKFIVLLSKCNYHQKYGCSLFTAIAEMLTIDSWPVKTSGLFCLKIALQHHWSCDSVALLVVLLCWILLCVFAQLLSLLVVICVHVHFHCQYFAIFLNVIDIMQHVNFWHI